MEQATTAWKAKIKRSTVAHLLRVVGVVCFFWAAVVSISPEQFWKWLSFNFMLVYIAQTIDPAGLWFWEKKPNLLWVPGRAFVLMETSEVEYFSHFEGGCIRSFCGGLRPISQCRQLDYVCDPRYLTRLV